MRKVIGIDALKDEYRKAKLMCGDLRGLKNRFELSAKFDIDSLQTFFNSTSSHMGERMELTADCREVDSDSSFTEYSMKDLVNQLKGQPGAYQIDLICLKWNKLRTDNVPKTVTSFMYQNLK